MYLKTHKMRVILNMVIFLLTFRQGKQQATSDIKHRRKGQTIKLLERVFAISELGKGEKSGCQNNGKY